MPAYVIVETDVSDPDRYEQYKAAGAAAVAAAGGRYLVRGGELNVFEGDWPPSRLVVLEQTVAVPLARRGAIRVAVLADLHVGSPFNGLAKLLFYCFQATNVLPFYVGNFYKHFPHCRWLHLINNVNKVLHFDNYLVKRFAWNTLSR